MKLLGVKHKLSTAFHPQTDGASEHSNKTIVQCICYHVDHLQIGWIKALSRICFGIMNTVNASTGFSPFQLKSGFLPHVLLPLFPPPPTNTLAKDLALQVLQEIETNYLEAMDNLITAKINQAHQANSHHSPEVEYKVGDKVILSTINCHWEYVQKQDGQVAKFMP